MPINFLALLLTSHFHIVFLGDPSLLDIQDMQGLYYANGIAMTYEIRETDITCDVDNVEFVHSYEPEHYTQLVLHCDEPTHGQCNNGGKLSIVKIKPGSKRPPLCVMMHEIGHNYELTHPTVYDGNKWVYDMTSVTVMNSKYASVCNYTNTEWESIK